MVVNSARVSPALDRRTLLVITALGAAALLVVMDGTAVTVSLERLQDTFSANLSTIVWVTSIYLISASLALPLVGWAADRFGARRLLLAGLGLFVLGSVASGLAQTAGMLIGARALQGFGAGMLEPGALALAAAIAPPERVGWVMGRMSLVINLGPVLGPILGGLLSGVGLWRWIFLVNLPLGLLVALVILRQVPPDPTRTPRGPADVRGMLLLSPGFAALLLAANRWGEGSSVGWVLLPGVGGVALLLGYLVHAARATDPVLDLRLMRIRPFAVALAVMFGVGILMYTQLTALPAYAEQVHGLEGWWRGALVTALGLGLLATMGPSGRISDRTGPRVLVRSGAAVAAAGMLTFALAAQHWPLPVVGVLFVLIGAGFGAVASTTFASIYRAVPPQSAAQGTTALFIVTQLGASSGVTLVGLVTARSPDHTTPILFAVIGCVAAFISVLARLLPAAPSTTP